MRIYLGKEGQTYGPYPRKTIQGWLRDGSVSPDDLGCVVGAREWIPLGQLNLGTSGNSPGVQAASHAPPPPAPRNVSFRTLRPQLLSPIGEFFRFEWITDWKILCIVLLGIFPLMSTTVVLNDDASIQKYWALALYFSGLWAFLFYGLVKPENATTKNMLICFFGTGIISIPIMLGFYEIDFFADMNRKAGSEEFTEQFIGMFFGVAILEEACKLAVLVVIWKWFSNAGISVRTYMFYGLMSGLGFGIYEGVMYQSERNNAIFDQFDFSDSDTSPEEFKKEVLDIYIANVWRLTTLPFLHATWCAISGFFFGLSTKYGYRWLLIGCGLAVPSLLHASHNSMPDHALGKWARVLVDALSIIALLVYWRNQAKIERSLS
jgi:RsiW-degrading membrane proteinase PrsW (M82 family)